MAPDAVENARSSLAVLEDVDADLVEKDHAALRQVLRTIRRHGDPASTWLWLESTAAVTRARSALPRIRCTLLRPSGWQDENRAMYFRDAEECGANAVSPPWGMITRQMSDEAHRQGLLVFSRLENSSRLDEFRTREIDGIIIDDPDQAHNLKTSG